MTKKYKMHLINTTKSNVSSSEITACGMSFIPDSKATVRDTRKVKCGLCKRTKLFKIIEEAERETSQERDQQKRVIEERGAMELLQAELAVWINQRVGLDGVTLAEFTDAASVVCFGDMEIFAKILGQIVIQRLDTEK